MKKFNYYMPTKVFWGRECVKQNGDALRSIGKRALVVTGKRSARASGALDDIAAALGSAAIPFALFDAVEPNPSIATARAAGEAARSFGAEMIVAAGGGSPLDAGKAAAVLACNDCADDDLFRGGFSTPPLPVVAVPTTAGTGSEVTPYSILTDPAKKTKRNLKSERLFPVMAFLNSRYTDSVPPEVTAHTAIDALTHAVEGYCSSRSMPVADALALRSIELVGTELAKLPRGAPGAEGRDNLLFASLLAGCVIAQTGTTVLHAMGYHLTFFHGVEHGRANGLLLAPYLRHVMAGRPDRITAVLASLGWGDLSALETMLRALLKGAIALSPGEVEEYSRVASETAGAASTIPRPGVDDIKSIYAGILRAGS
ncbi:MAG: iron-containing alcohol dehydrogenase [Spirochaetes bacterium]|nr:iron-containing alcohol dehydrogenase [Spirochaetota bacterium]